jgi:E3 ubiquitin-protein ligase MARCH6
MPDKLPAHLLALRSVQSALQAGLLGLRVALVALVWLAIVPWMSIWTLRCVLFSSFAL